MSIIIQTCPECGADLEHIVYTTYPPIPAWQCSKCRWYKRTYPVYTFGEFSARCLLGGCDGSQYDPRDEKGKGISTYFTCSNCGAKMGEDGDE